MATTQVFSECCSACCSSLFATCNRATQTLLARLAASSLCHLRPSCQVARSSCARSDIAGLSVLRLALLCRPVCKRASSGAAAVARESKNCEAAADELAVWSTATSPCFLPAYITTRDPEDASLVHLLSDFRCKKFSICSLLPSKEREGFSHWRLL